MHVNKVKGVFNLSLYCPFWMVNKTGFDITYKVILFQVSRLDLMELYMYTYTYIYLLCLTDLLGK